MSSECVQGDDEHDAIRLPLPQVNLTQFSPTRDREHRLGHGTTVSVTVSLLRSDADGNPVHGRPGDRRPT